MAIIIKPNNTILFSVNQNLLDFLDQNNIRTNTDGKQRWKNGDVIQSKVDTILHSHTAHLQGNQILNIGSFSYSNSLLNPNMKIGRYCSIAGNVQVMGIQHPLDCVTTSQVFFDKAGLFSSAFHDPDVRDWKWPPLRQPEDPEIHNDVWIGQNVILKRGITIGTGAVVGAGAVVVKDIGPYEIVGGVPAKRIKMRFDDAIIHEMLKLKWWDYGIHQLPDIAWANPPRFIAEMHDLLDRGVAKPFNSNLGLVKDIVAAL